MARLKCTTGNYQCGRACIPDSKNCVLKASDIQNQTIDDLTSMVEAYLEAKTGITPDTAKKGKLGSKAIQNRLKKTQTPDAFIKDIEQHLRWTRRQQEKAGLTPDPALLKDGKGKASASAAAPAPAPAPAAPAPAPAPAVPPPDAADQAKRDNLIKLIKSDNDLSPYGWGIKLPDLNSLSTENLSNIRTLVQQLSAITNTPPTYEEEGMFQDILDLTPNIFTDGSLSTPKERQIILDRAEEIKVVSAKLNLQRTKENAGVTLGLTPEPTLRKPTLADRETGDHLKEFKDQLAKRQKAEITLGTSALALSDESLDIAREAISKAFNKGGGSFGDYFNKWAPEVIKFISDFEQVRNNAWGINIGKFKDWNPSVLKSIVENLKNLPTTPPKPDEYKRLQDYLSKNPNALKSDAGLQALLAEIQKIQSTPATPTSKKNGQIPSLNPATGKFNRKDIKPGMEFLLDGELVKVQSMRKSPKSITTFTDTSGKRRVVKDSNSLEIPGVKKRVNIPYSEKIQKLLNGESNNPELDTLEAVLGSVTSTSKFSNSPAIRKYMEDLYTKYGYHEKPELVSSFSELESRNDVLRTPDGKAVVAYRGFGNPPFSAALREGFINGEKHFGGQGIFGHGTYAAIGTTDKNDNYTVRANNVASIYTNSKSPSKVAFGISSNAKLFGDYESNATDVTAKLRQEYAKMGFTDKPPIEVMLMKLGYDGFLMKRDDIEPTLVLLNRAVAIVVEDQTVGRGPGDKKALKQLEWEIKNGQLAPTPESGVSVDDLLKAISLVA